MANEELKIDANNKSVIGMVTDDASQEIRMGRIDDVTKGLMVTVVGGSASGTVTDVSVVTANGVSGSVATATTTPAITLTLGAITPSSVASTGAITTGANGGTIGSVKLFGNTSGDVTLTPNAIAGTGIVLTLPATTGTLVTGGGTASGTNTGDNATNTQYSGLAASKADVGQTFYIGTTQVAINRASAALTLAGLTLTTPDIGTPSAGVLTNAIGLPAASVVAGVLGVTGTRMTKLWAIDIESTNAPTVGGVVVPTISSTSTLTNKRINPRLVTAASYTTDTGTSLDVSTCDQFEITAQAGALLFNSPSGTPLGGQKLTIRIKDNGTARALTYNAIFRAMGNVLPTTTVLSKTLYMGFIYNATDTKWDLVAVAQEA